MLYGTKLYFSFYKTMLFYFLSRDPRIGGKGASTNYKIEDNKTAFYNSLVNSSENLSVVTTMDDNP